MSTDLRISGAQTTPRSESDIRVNFNNPSHIIAASNAIGASNQAQFYSTDGGVTWNQTTLPLNAGDSLHSDPTVDWTSDGTAWATTIGIDAGQTVLQIRAYKSTNSGATWTFDATVTGAQTAADKQMMWVDHSPTSPHRDNIYVIWHNNNPVFVNRRTGPAGSWQAPLQISGAETTGTGIGGDIKTNSSGDVFAFWPDTGSQNLFVAKSTNGGVGFGAPVRIATTFDSYDIGMPSFATRRALIYISGGAYRTATKNMVYAVWTDQTGVAGCNSPANEPGTNVASICKTRIWFARSADGGITWGAASMLHNQASLNDQFNPWMAVDETNGQLVVMYYDTVSDAGRKKVDVWTQISSDDGATWTAAAKVTSAQTDETSAGANAGNQYGDYNGLSGYAGKFFPCWTDRRGGGAEEVWTASFKLTVLVIAIANNGNFGNICLGGFADELLTINNSGSSPLSISNITSSSPDFLPPSVVTYPIIVAPFGSVDVMLRFQPTSPGPKSAIITVISDDPTGPQKISVSGDGQTSRLSLVMPDTGDFGKVCIHSFEDEPLLFSNSGKCALSIASITSSSADFIVGEVLFYPLTIGAGDSLQIPIRFQPGSAGLKSATITVNSDDPAGSHKITVSGDGQTPRLSLMIADTGDFGKVCVGSLVDKPLTLINSGRCMLTVTNIASSDSEFLAPLVSAYPIVIAAGCSLEAPIRFQPASFGLKVATITVLSDDPAGLRTMAVSGFAPSGKLTVTGSTSFGGVTACCCADRTLSICNTGDCGLHVTSVRFKRKSRHWKILHNPFPATLHAGSCLNVVIRYNATEKCPRACELIIESDDPITPAKTMDVLAYTIWDPCGCKDCCEECRRGTCDKRHTEPCCRQGYPCCDDDDDD